MSRLFHSLQTLHMVRIGDLSAISQSRTLACQFTKQVSHPKHPIGCNILIQLDGASVTLCIAVALVVVVAGAGEHVDLDGSVSIALLRCSSGRVSGDWGFSDEGSMSGKLNFCFFSGRLRVVGRSNFEAFSKAIFRRPFVGVRFRFCFTLTLLSIGVIGTVDGVVDVKSSLGVADFGAESTGISWLGFWLLLLFCGISISAVCEELSIVII